ncbi:MAG TPA: DsbA family protein [Solirubrobacteraceae bacterium]|jgi:predicted DsbA family dithiol-disulfide isomerase|nr:DsbA family protein [Solirubrobacteraceae bacterium]
MAQVAVTHFSDPGCPWAYSASPALAVLRWRYGEQLDWRLVTIGLSEDPSRYAELGYTPTRMAVGNLGFRRFGMPFAAEPRARIAATARACRTIVAARLLASGREHEVHRALQFAWFTSTLVLDEDADIAAALARVGGLDVEAVVGAIEDEWTIAAYEADRAETRTAEGGATEFQGKARRTDGSVRYSAPSLVFEAGGRRLEAGGFQSVEAYDLLIANLERTLVREPPPEDPLPVLRRFPDGLVT